MSFRNVAAWRQAIDQAEQDVQRAIYDAGPPVARYTRDTIRKRVPPGATTRQGMTNRFPGYAATGRLKSKIVASPRRKHGRGGGWRIEVGLAANTTRLDRIKAVVHEYGRVIYARRAPYLVFQIEGKWIKVKRVRIRAKRFFRSGWAEARRNFPDVLGEQIRQRWPANKRYNGGR